MRPASSIRFLQYATGMFIVFILGGCAADRHHSAGMSAMEQGSYVDAVRELELAAALEPQDVTFKQDWLTSREKATQRLFAKAETALAEGRDVEAEQYFRTILKFDRENARALAGLEAITRTARAAEDAAQAREAFKHGDLVLAQQWIARALERAPRQAEARAVQREIDALQAKELATMPSLGSVYKKPINLEFRDASLKMVFEALSRTTGINFIFDHDVKSDQHTTVFLKQTTLEDAIDVILTTSQLDKKILNNSSVLIYPNTAAKTKEYQDLMVKAFYVANADVKQTATMLKTVLKIKEIYVDEKTNMLVLRENPDTISLAEKLIALQDLDEPEVMLEVEVLEITRSRMRDLGIQITNQLTISPLSSLSSTTSAATGSTAAATPTAPINTLQHLNSSLLGITLPSATLNFQKVDSDVNLLANPRIRVRDREKAKILIGDKVPVVTTTTTATGFVAENIQYIDVGIKLDVEPEIRLHDEIGLKLGLEVSSLDSTITTSNGSQAYQIGTRNFNSVLRLKDGETQILGGLISKTDSSNANRFPILGEIPLLGRLFSNQNDNAEKTEIVLSITPRLIRNIQRKEPSAESFWSGTEATLRTKPLQLRSIEGSAAPAASAKKSIPQAVPTSNTGVQQPSAGQPNQPASQAAPNVDPSNFKAFWKGPAQGKVGEVLTLELDLDSVAAVKTVPLQLAFNPAQFEVVSVKEGDFFNKDGKAVFNQVIDKQSGRISVGAGSEAAAGVKGNGSLLTIALKPLEAATEADISLIGITPIGGSQAVSRLPLPLVHKLEIVP